MITKLAFSNGSYTGEVKDGNMHGKGKYTWANGDVYDGDWRDDKRNGKGKLSLADGDVYDGDWRDGKMHGKGKYTWANGDVYDGEWRDGKQSGGNFTDADGVHKEIWEDGMRVSTSPRHTFFTKLTEMMNTATDSQLSYQSFEELSTLVEDVNTMKLVYTAVATCYRLKALTMEEASKILRLGLGKTSKTCTCEDTIVIFKLILGKAERDGFISEADKHRFDNRAEVKRMEHAPFIKGMMETIQSNTKRIENAEGNVKVISESVNKIKQGMKRKNQIECAFGLMSAVISVATLGIGGVLMKPFEMLAMDSIIDFGDPTHIIGTIREQAQKLEVDPEEYEKLINDGKEASVDMVKEEIASKKLNDAINDKHPLVVISTVSHMVYNAGAELKQPGLVEANKGDAAIQVGNCFEAIAWYTKAIAIDDSNNLYFSKRSKAYLERGDFFKAEEDADQVISINGTNPEGYLRKGYALFALKKYEQAIMIFEEGLKHCPDNIVLEEGLKRVKDDELCKRFYHDMKITNINGEKADMTQSHHQIKQLLETHLPGLQKEDVEKYCKCFANEGFDSAQTFKELEEEDLDTMKMKKGHKRALLKSLKKEE